MIERITTQIQVAERGCLDFPLEIGWGTLAYLEEELEEVAEEDEFWASCLGC